MIITVGVTDIPGFPMLYYSHGNFVKNNGGIQNMMGNARDDLKWNHKKNAYCMILCIEKQ